MSDLKEGYYWARIKNEKEFDKSPLEWEIVYWDGFCFERMIYEAIRKEFVEELGSRIPSPEEPWQCVPKEPTRGMMMNAFAGSGVYSSTAYKQMLAEAPSPDDHDA